jgi:hypothetical protein
MVNKFLIAIAAVVAVMAALVLIPNFYNNNSPAEEQQNLSIEYQRQNLTRTEDGRLMATRAEDLVIRPDRSAVYRNLTGAADVKQFTISNEDMNRLEGLIISTGFMQVPGADYPEKEGLGNFTKYTVKLASGGTSKTITWANLEASDNSVPSIVRNIGAELDAIIKRHI